MAQNISFNYHSVFLKMLVDGGYITFGVGGIPKYHFYQNDHLGNVRVVSDANGTVEEVNHYYPYGALMGESQNTTAQPYKYNGKELDLMHGLNQYDYGARLYDPLVGQFTSIDPLCEKYYSVSPYAYCAGNPINAIDPDGESPFSALIKYTTKQGVKTGIKSFVKNNIEHRLKNYMSKDMLKQFTKDADDIVSTLDNSWWEIALELVPVVGDIYGTSKFVKQVEKIYNKLQALENKYVRKIYNSLPDEPRKRFVRNMRSKGIADARKDQAKGLDMGGDVKYEKGKNIDGHHQKNVAQHPEKMTDPRTIEFMEQSNHIKYHQKYGY